MLVFTLERKRVTLVKTVHHKLGVSELLVGVEGWKLDLVAICIIV